jgi:hypothetical protein
MCWAWQIYELLERADDDDDDNGDDNNGDNDDDSNNDISLLRNPS